MAVNYVYVVFLLAGVIFGTFVWVPKFVLLSIVTASSYFMYSVALRAGIGQAFINAIIGFVCVQIGYVGGLALKLLYRKIFRNDPLVLSFRGDRKEHSEAGARPHNH